MTPSHHTDACESASLAAEQIKVAVASIRACASAWDTAADTVRVLLLPAMLAYLRSVKPVILAVAFEMALVEEPSKTSALWDMLELLGTDGGALTRFTGKGGIVEAPSAN